jgi:lipopolysaccharide export system protein LptC
MSEQAELQRSSRQRMSLPGGRHDRMVRVLRVFLPSVIGVLLALLAFSPFSQNREMSFLLAKDEVNMAKERMRVANALYRGKDSAGRPFSLSVGSAVQKSSAEPILKMTDIKGDIAMSDGPASVIAAKGYYDMSAETIRAQGPLSFAGANGFNVTADDVEFFMKTKIIRSLGPVNGTTGIGTFRAGHLFADVDARIIRLDGGAHLQINQITKR